MKKLFAILMALMVLGFTQCKPAPEGNDGDNGDVRMVKVRCEIPMNNGSRSDFANLITTGKINWGQNGVVLDEYVYVAVHGDNPQIIQLSASLNGTTPSVLAFEGEAAENVITESGVYDIWYFGHSHIADTAKYQMIESGSVCTQIKGSIATQSGKLSELGYCHIATTKVSANVDEQGNAELVLNAVFKNQIAILLLNLEKVDKRYGLYGDAIKGTEYSLDYNYNEERYELNVEYNPSAKIDVVDAEEGTSYIALFPNDIENTEIRYRDGSSVHQYIMNGEIEANNFYYNGTGGDINVLPWAEVSTGDVVHGEGDNKHYHHYVDLGLTSRTLWATYNVGADTMYHYGDYFSWGEIEPKAEYYLNNCATNGQDIGDISGNAAYDAATAIWGDEWRMPTYDEQQELFKDCVKEPLKMPAGYDENGIIQYVNGYKFTGPNGNYIFLPAAGYRDSDAYADSLGVVKPAPEGGYRSVGQWGHYWNSTPLPQQESWTLWSAQALYFDKGWASHNYIYTANRFYGCSIRPVLKKKAYEIEHDHE
ncbi:MAG: hypothetical protein IKW54_08045 [Bacteroidales bacterium]|nr:hypothetical protein [Bacteroidales bacterium]